MRKFISFLLLPTILLVSCNQPAKKQVKIDKPNISQNEIKNTNPETIKISLTAVGDILVHQDQLNAQYNSNTKTYDFKNNFTFVKPFIQNSDISIASLETNLAGESRKYSGYPVFNTPDTILDALKDCGFDILSTANNHSMDMGAESFFRTVKVEKEKGFDVIGTKENANDKSYVIKNVKGIQIGFSNYTFETAPKGNNKTLNQIIIPKLIEPLIDTFNNDTLDNDILKMKTRIDLMKKEGAEVIIFYVHWGTEYYRNSDANQQKLAQALSDNGVDIILGSHPHVIEPIKYIYSAQSKKKTLVFYSLGNFISNQRYERLNQRYSEDGMIANITIVKNLKTDQILINQVAYEPTWVNKYTLNGKDVYEIVPLFDGLNNKEEYNLASTETLWRAENSLKNTSTLIDENSTEFVHEPLLNSKVEK